MIGLAALRCHGERHGPHAACPLCSCYGSGSVWDANHRDEWCTDPRCDCHDETLPRLCDVGGCIEPYAEHGMCAFHLARARVGLPLEPVE